MTEAKSGYCPSPPEARFICSLWSAGNRTCHAKRSVFSELILMNTAQSHFPDVAWLLDRFPLSRRVFTSLSRAVQAQLCLRGMGVAVLPWPLADAISGLQRILTPHQPPCRDTGAGYHHDLRYRDTYRQCWISPIRCFRLPCRQRLGARGDRQGDAADVSSVPEADIVVSL